LYFIAATIEEKTTMEQWTNKCSQELHFVIEKNALPLFPQDLIENTTVFMSLMVK
jgi:hypothetical protein